MRDTPTNTPTQNQRGNSVLNSELKPCPFCGGAAKIKKTTQCLTEAYSVICKDKECRGRAVKPLRDIEAAIVAWNRRATDERAD
jgi:Lar family restriction alleviation protein